MDAKELSRIEQRYSEQLKKMRALVMPIYEKAVEADGMNRRKSLLSMHALIGSKNNTFVDSVRMQFINPKDFIAKWISGLIKQYGDKEYTRSDGTKYRYILIDLLKNKTFLDYVILFHTRNFYRNLEARVRFKPNEILWELWFGSGNFALGLLITPTYRNGKWTNDVSEIRRAEYKYWTIGHVMKTGFVDPDSEDKIMFHTYDELFVFYKSIFKKLSNSKYEKEIFDRYIDYLKHSSDIDEEPLLIPEIRYAGLNKEHLYRMDFTILNPHTQEYIGFELSPSSSHMSVGGIRGGKTQKEMNEELAQKWMKEMKKRNEYFSEFGIYTITFTDDQLENIDCVFDVMRKYLSNRGEESVDLDEELSKLLAL